MKSEKLRNCHLKIGITLWVETQLVPGEVTASSQPSHGFNKFSWASHDRNHTAILLKWFYPILRRIRAAVSSMLSVITTVDEFIIKKSTARETQRGWRRTWWWWWCLLLLAPWRCSSFTGGKKGAAGKNKSEESFPGIHEHPGPRLRIQIRNVQSCWFQGRHQCMSTPALTEDVSENTAGCLWSDWCLPGSSVRCQLHCCQTVRRVVQNNKTEESLTVHTVQPI